MKTSSTGSTLPTGLHAQETQAQARRSLTLLVPGTRWRRFGGWGEENALFRLATEVLGQSAAGARTELFEWPGGNSHRSRLDAAEALTALIASRALDADDRLHVVGHSHGGNVALLASNRALPHAIDTLITLNKPTLSGRAYQAGPGVRNFYNIGARRDWLQWAGSNRKLGNKWAVDARAENLVLDTSSSKLHPHAAMIWDDAMRERWYAWLKERVAR